MKVLIPTAGVGSRLGDLTQHVNKAMIAVGKRPVISHIIDRYPVDTEFIVALGFKGDYLRQYLELAYPRSNIQFVDIDLFDGPGSGPGYTLQQCKPLIDQPFVFHANDSIIVDANLDFEFHNDTMLAVKGPSDPIDYRTISIDEQSGRVIGVHDKMRAPQSKNYNYIGVAYVHRYRDFTDSLDEISVEIGESAYFMESLDKGIDSYLVDAWYDIGNLDQLRRATEALSDFDNLQKSGESLYFLDGRVLKFSVDEQFIDERVERAKRLEGLTPTITDRSKNFYVYNFVPGEILSDLSAPAAYLESLLRWSESNLWNREELSSAEQESFDRTCFRFYYDKTIDRVNEFFGRFNTGDQSHEINGMKVPAIDSLLAEIDWAELRQGVPVKFHGDFHFENVVKTDGGFVLLDWRQNFGGEQRYGDIYYDLAKLLHGLIVSHRIIRENLFNVSVSNDRAKVEFDFYRRNSLIACESVLRDWCDENGYDWRRVEIVTSLIFLNIAPLHHYPYSHMLFFLGKSMLNDVLANGSDDV